MLCSGRRNPADGAAGAGMFSSRTVKAMNRVSPATPMLEWWPAGALSQGPRLLPPGTLCPMLEAPPQQPRPWGPPRLRWGPQTPSLRRPPWPARPPIRCLQSTWPAARTASARGSTGGSARLCCCALEHPPHLEPHMHMTRAFVLFLPQRQELP